MANNQPVNTDIVVKNRVRAYRQNLLHGSIKDTIDRMRTLVMSVVSKEQLVVVTRDTATEYLTDTSLMSGRGSSLPLVRYLRAVLTFTSAANTLYAAGQADFPVQVGQDKFLQPQDTFEGHATKGDIQTNLAAL